MKLNEDILIIILKYLFPDYNPHIILKVLLNPEYTDSLLDFNESIDKYKIKFGDYKIKTWNKNIYKNVLLSGNFKLVKQLDSVNCKLPTDYFDLIAKSGNLEVLKFFHLKNPNPNTLKSCSFLPHIFSSGNIDIISWVCKTFDLNENQKEMGVSYSIKLNHKELFYFCKNNFNLDFSKFPFYFDLFIISLNNNNLKNLKWLTTQINFPKDKRFFEYAATTNSSFEILKFLFDSEMIINDDIFKIEDCCFEVFEYFYTVLNCKIPQEILNGDFTNMNLDSIIWFYNHGCILTEKTFYNNLLSNFINDRIKIVEWLKNNNCPYDYRQCYLRVEKYQTCLMNSAMYWWVVDNLLPLQEKEKIYSKEERTQFIF